MKRRLVTIGLVSVMSLATLATGYALWSETLRVEGEVTTGFVGVEWSIENPGRDDEGKEVSDIVCTVEPDQGGTLAQKLIVTVTNAYPSVNYFCDVDIHGTGSVPVHVHDVEWKNVPSGVHAEFHS